MPQLDWEQISNDYSKIQRGLKWNTYRTKVFGGWLVFTQEWSGENQSITFYPDTEHQWDGNLNLNWEQLSNDYSKIQRGLKWHTYRAKVFGGWLVFTQEWHGDKQGITFYPDIEHQWDGCSML